MNRLLLFNSSNDLALASNAKEYIATKSIAAMESDLAALPAWWAADGDAILLRCASQVEEARMFFRQKGFNVVFTSPEEGYHALCKRTENTYTPTPWGWSRAAVSTFQQFGIPQEQLPHDNETEAIRALSSRSFASEYIAELLHSPQFARQAQSLIGNEMRFIRSLQELSMSHRTIFKSPWSSSGRGIFAANSIDEPSIREKLTGFIKRQGGFLADKFYDKTADFALEFYIEKDGTTKFIGYSVFAAGINGYYGHNVVAPQEQLRETIIANGCDATLLDELIDYHCHALKKWLKGKYHGVVGIDMITANEQGAIKTHPCIEINLRMNIGVLALCVEKKGFAGNYNLTPPPKNKAGFYATVNDSKLIIGYSK